MHFAHKKTKKEKVNFPQNFVAYLSTPKTARFQK